MKGVPEGTPHKRVYTAKNINFLQQYKAKKFFNKLCDLLNDINAFVNFYGDWELKELRQLAKVDRDYKKWLDAIYEACLRLMSGGKIAA